MRHDFIGQIIEEGDFIVMQSPTYRHLLLARITGFKPKMVMVDVFDQHAWRTTVHPNKITKVPAEYAIAKMMAKG